MVEAGWLRWSPGIVATSGVERVASAKPCAGTQTFSVSKVVAELDAWPAIRARLERSRKGASATGEEIWMLRERVTARLWPGAAKTRMRAVVRGRIQPSS